MASKNTQILARDLDEKDWGNEMTQEEEIIKVKTQMSLLQGAHVFLRKFHRQYPNGYMKKKTLIKMMKEAFQYECWPKNNKISDYDIDKAIKSIAYEQPMQGTVSF